MIGGLITLGLGMFASLIMHKCVLYNPDTYPLMQKLRLILIAIMIIAIIPVTIQEVYSGHFKSWIFGLFINSWEMICFCLGFYYHDWLMKKGWILQYIIVN